MEDLAAPDPPPRRRRRFVWLALGGAVLVAASVGAAFATSDRLSRSEATTELDGLARIFSLDEVRTGRERVRLLDFAGKPVVLNFFGSWCPPCLREMPDIQAVHERYGDQVGFVGVTFTDTRRSAARVLADTGVTYPAGYDPENKVALAYKLSKMPTTIFISADGVLLEKAEGELSEPQLVAIIERLFDVEPVS